MISTVRPDLHLTLSTRAPLVRAVERSRTESNRIDSSMISSNSWGQFSSVGALNASNSSSSINVSGPTQGTGERRRSLEESNIAIQSSRRASPSPGGVESRIYADDRESGRISPTPSLASLDIDKVRNYDYSWY